MASQEEPVKTIIIPYIHPKLDLVHLNANGKLFTDAQIEAIQKNPLIVNAQGRITKKKLNEIFKNEIDSGLLTPFKFSLEKSDNNYRAIYKGKEHSLGSGSFGSVKILQDLLTGKTTEVLKVIKESTPTEITEEEIGLKKAAQFKALHQRSDKTNQYEFVMDLAKGVSLDTMIRKKLPTVKLIDLAINVLREVKQLHDKGIIHRDIKPENILYDPVSKKATMIDLGISLYVANAEEVMSGVKLESMNGTYSYMSPAALTGFYNEKTEIFALALTLGEIFGLTQRKSEYLSQKDRYQDFLRIKDEDDVKWNTKISDQSTLLALHTLLKQMTSDGNVLSLSNINPDSVNLINAFERIREEYIDAAGLTNKIAYLNVAEYANATAENKEAMLQALEETDEVWLIDDNGNNKDIYLTLQHELLARNVNTSDVVVQYQGNNLDQVMSSYAEQREVQDRALYDCSNLTKTGQLAPLKTTLNQQQVSIIFTSLQSEIKNLQEKYGSEAQERVQLINDTMENIKKNSQEKPVTLAKVLRELDSLQSKILSTTESQKNIIKLMQDIEKWGQKKALPLANARGFDAVRKLQSEASRLPPPLPPGFQKQQPPPLPPQYQKQQPPPLPAQKQQPPPLPAQYRKQPPPVPQELLKQKPPPLPPRPVSKAANDKLPPPLPVSKAANDKQAPSTFLKQGGFFKVKTAVEENVTPEIKKRSINNK
ncbi:MAG: protein kinase [Pseudomonadota bacterium]